MDDSRPTLKRRYQIEEIAEIVSRYKVMTKQQGLSVKEAQEVLAKNFDRSPDSIRVLLSKFRPTVEGATAYLQAQALKLAMRVTRKANVDQSIDILGRSNIGVLAPKQEAGGGSGGFFISVRPENCGAVNIAVAGTPQTFSDLPQPLQLPEDTSELETISPLQRSALLGNRGIEGEVIEEKEVLPPLRVTTPGVPHPTACKFGRFNKPIEEWPERNRRDVESAKKKLREARKLARTKEYRELDALLAEKEV